MLNLSTHLRLDESVAKATNLVGRIDKDDLAAIGTWVWEGYQRDEDSRSAWRRRTQAAMDLALQLQREKSFPWPNCANVAFPLVTIAAMQFHSRAYPALISGTDIVKYRCPAPDPQGEAYQRACRVGDYMSYQVLEEDQAWEEQHDRALLQIPIVGCAFVKTYFDASLGHNVSELVPASNLVLDYYAKSVEQCGRKTHLLQFYRNQIYEKCVSGVWDDFLDEPWYCNPQAPLGVVDQSRVDQRTGIHPPSNDDSSPLSFLEQHCSLDLDQDGYAEPYIVTVEANSKRVVRVVARWEAASDVERLASGRVLRIRPTEYFTKYGLIPSPDGSIYDMGFGILLGPLNESVNSLVNILMDSGTISVAAGGFLARGVKIRGGAYQFSPFGWNRVDSTGDDLQKGVMPLPVREPSQVLFTLLDFLVNYTQRIAGAVDALQGENPGQNMKAGTYQGMVENGMKIYSALFKRVWRCMKEEFRKLYLLDARYLPATKKFGVNGFVAREDFLGDPSQIAPVADPNVTSDAMRVQLAGAIAERARAVPGYDVEACERNLLHAMRVEGADNLYGGLEKFPPAGDPKMQIAQMQAQVKMAELQQKQQQFVIELLEERRVNNAQIIQLMAQAEKFAADAQFEAASHQVGMIDAMVGVLKLKEERLTTRIDGMLKAIGLQHSARELDQRDRELDIQENEPATTD